MSSVQDRSESATSATGRDMGGVKLDAQTQELLDELLPQLMGQ